MSDDRSRNVRRRRRFSDDTSSNDDGDTASIILRRFVRHASGRNISKNVHGRNEVSFWWAALASGLLLSTFNPTTKESFAQPSELFDVDDVIFESKMIPSDTGNLQNNNRNTWKLSPQSRPNGGLRWRGEFHASSPLSYDWATRTMAQPQNMLAMPLLTERHHRGQMLGGLSSSRMVPTTSSEATTIGGVHQDPSLEDMELIDVLWRSDIDAEKGAPTGSPQEQYEKDLQTLTEKSTVVSLSCEESTRYQNLAKVFYEDYFTKGLKENRPAGPPPTTSAYQLAEIEKRSAPTPTDADLDALLEDVTKEGGQLDRLEAVFETFEPPQDVLLNNVTLAQTVSIEAHNNLTDLSSFVEDQPVNQDVASQNTLYNGTVELPLWMKQHELGPADIFPMSTNHSYMPPFPQNETAVPVMSSGTSFDHQYQASATNVPEGSPVSQPPVYDPYFTSSRTMSFSNDSSSCVSSSSTSPRYGRESENINPESRYYGKLAPKKEVDDMRYHNIKEETDVDSSGPRRRGRQSKDEQLASTNNLPVTARQIADMTLSELQKVLRDEQLTDYQRQLIRKIRRRGKNKVAARTCRQRRGDRKPNFDAMHQGCETPTLYEDI